MDILREFINIFFHLDKYLTLVIQQYDQWTYAILFAVIFCETGLVVTPLLPGDSLLFAAGAFAATGALNLFWLLGGLSVAAILGDTVNYWMGYAMGPRVFKEGNRRVFKKEYLDRTQAFYDKYGGKTIIIARFVPIVRTFAPFVAGVGKMNYGKFIFYNITGGLLWVAVCCFAGYFFGNIPVVKDNFTLVILAIIFISILPGVIELVRQRRLNAPPGAA